MVYDDIFSEVNEFVSERYDLALERIKNIVHEQAVPMIYRDYFKNVAMFILDIQKVYRALEADRFLNKSIEELKYDNKKLYEDILPENYNHSYGNPDYAVDKMGEEAGRLLGFLYAEIRGMIIYAFENRMEDMVIHMELFIEIYNVFEDEEPNLEQVREAIYYFVSDYSDMTIDYRNREQFDPELDYIYKLIMDVKDWEDISYLYQYGEYIGENEIGTAKFLAKLSEDEIDKMAATFTEGFIVGYDINVGKSLSNKKSINIRYNIGQERLVKAAIEQFKAVGLAPIMYRGAINRINRRLSSRIGVVGISPNKQYDYDHRIDEGLFLDKAFVNRKLEVLEGAFETRKDKAREYAGPAVIEVFGEKTFTPVNKKTSIMLTEEQRKLQVELTSKASNILNKYVPNEEYSFTIIAYPLPDIGKDYEDIYRETVKINTLDVNLYRNIQQSIIDQLDKAVKVRVVGMKGNKTDITVNMHVMKDATKETKFENCLADVNIPVGEVFTSPKLEGTNGTLHVSHVYLNDLEYKDIEITFKEGMIDSYTCKNFEDEQENKNYILENVLFNHKTLPIGEFAIGTNTTAYVMAHKYNIMDKMPILIAEKTGPHFAVGDTCYSHTEEVVLHNPDGKEIVAKDNECSLLRDEDESKAYFNCHTDITIPYNELGLIEAVMPDESTVPIIENGRFVLAGTEELNKVLDELIVK